jgi:protein-L-isoaspartate(D-aspartate) O-methyltransferase
MVEKFKADGILVAEKAIETMLRVDRKCFVQETDFKEAYNDNSRRIGWNTTISAPHMHARTLEELCPALCPGGKAVDIGTGSGYLAVCFAEMMGEGSTVYALDHI